MISAVVLAAGTSSRMGQPKPLVSLADKPLLSHVLDSLRRSRVEEVVVVLGYASDQVRRSIPLDGLRVIENPRFEDGMSTSLRAGVAALSPRSEAFLVVLGDAPFVLPSTLDALIAARERTGARIVLPVYQGIRGNPVLLDRTLANEVEPLTGDRGCRALRLAHPQETVEVPVDDPGVVIDLDTTEDLARAREALAENRSLESVAREMLRSSHPLAPSSRAPPRRMRGSPDVLALASELERRREPFCLALVTRGSNLSSGLLSAKAVIRANGAITGGIGEGTVRQALLAEARRALETGEPQFLRWPAASELRPSAGPDAVDKVKEGRAAEPMEVYVEPHLPPPELVVVGDSPVAESLAALGRLTGYRVVAAGVDLDRGRFPDADEVIGDLSSLATKLSRESYAVVATLAEYDASALESLVRSPAQYIALVASRRRAALLRDELRARGASPDAVDRIRNPAGLDVGARTPEEIAVSIMAEIIKVRRAGAPSSAERSPG